LVAAEEVALVGVDRREEDYRDVRGAFARLDQLRRLEAVQPRHLDVQEDRREVAGEQLPQRLVARGGADEPFTQRLQYGFQGQQVLRPVVHDQDVHRRAGGVRQLGLAAPGGGRRQAGLGGLRAGQRRRRQSRRRGDVRSGRRRLRRRKRRRKRRRERRREGRRLRLGA